MVQGAASCCRKFNPICLWTRQCSVMTGLFFLTKRCLNDIYWNDFLSLGGQKFTQCTAKIVETKCGLLNLTNNALRFVYYFYFTVHNGDFKSPSLVSHMWSIYFKNLHLPSRMIIESGYCNNRRSHVFSRSWNGHSNFSAFARITWRTVDKVCRISPLNGAPDLVICLNLRSRNAVSLFVRLLQSDEWHIVN